MHESKQASPTLRLKRSQAAMLQLAPGLANLLVFAPLAWWFHQAGLPAMLALVLAIVVAEIPVSWLLMIRVTRLETGGPFRWCQAFPWSAASPWWQYVVIGAPLIVFGMIVIGVLTPVVAGWIRDALGLQVPQWFLLDPDPAMFATLPREVLVTLWISALLVFAGVGGVTQELYARGFLLPRCAHWGSLAPAFNAVMFGVFHLNAPWSWPGFVLLALPWAYLTWWTRSIRIALLGHVGMLLVQSLLMALIVFGLVDPARMSSGG